jgi:peptide-methionine (S)-S-oxide reductase
VHLPPEGSALSPELRGLVGLSARLSVRANISAYCKNSRMRSTAYFATGCFWGAERRFWQMDGVLETSVGYMGGIRPNPTYEQVCTGVTGHAEMVKVVFDETVVSYQRLLEEFWTMHDPTSLNKQGGDIGTQYRSAIFATSPEQMKTALASRAAYQSVLTPAGMDEICTEILSADGIEYFEAEEYHQKYLQKNPNGYDCHSSTGVAYPA